MFAAVNLQTASKDELMSIKGIGPVKADQIMKYRKSNKISSANDLQNIKGFGPGIIANVKGNKTVTKAKMGEKKQKSRIEDKRKSKISKSKEFGMSKNELKTKKQKINKKVKAKKTDIKTNAKTKKSEKKAKMTEKNKKKVDK